MQPTLLLLLLLLTSAFTYGQNSIKGKITGENKQAVSKATVSVKQKSKVKTITAGEDGFYEITDLPNGHVVINVSAVGFETASETIILNNSSKELDFVLPITSSQLQSVEVIGRHAQKYNSDYTFSATRTAILNKDLPQSIGTVTKELINDRQAFQLADAVKIIPGVIPSSYYNQYSIRGISQNEEGQIVNGMRTRQY